MFSAPAQPTPPRQLPRLVHLILFFAGAVWLFLAHAAAGRVAANAAFRWNLGTIQFLIEQGSLIVLLILGFAALSFVARRPAGIRIANALPSRPSTLTEWLSGLALGWGMLLAAILPMMLTGTLHPQFHWLPSAWGSTVLSLATILLATLALELAFRGFLYIRLIASVGPVIATIVLSLLYALLSTLRPNSTATGSVVTFLFGILFSMAYLRTHALWFGWGLHFGWNATLAVLFGLPLAGFSNDVALVSTTVGGREWFTGGAYGPEAAILTPVVLLISMAALYRMTRDFAWHYTHPEIVPAGAAVTIAPPAAHAAMEASAPPATLVQILSTTSTTSSTLPVIDDHLRNRPE